MSSESEDVAEVRLGVTDPASAALGLRSVEGSWTERVLLARPGKFSVGMRLDRDLVQYFKAEGPAYETRINAVLRRYVEAHERAPGSNAVNALAPSDPLLAYRLRQQSLLSDFGLLALRTTDFDVLLQGAAETCADGMKAQFAKVLEYVPGEDRLRVRAGVGWGPGVVGEATIGADIESPAGYALKTGAPVISNHLMDESRFRTPKLLADHGIKRAINVIVRSTERGEPFGVLEVDTTSSGQFDEADLAFMQGFANLLGVAIERQRAEAARRESDEQARVIIEGARDYAIFTMDAAGTITSWCPGAEAIFGWSGEDIVGQDGAILFTPEDREAGVPELELAKAGDSGCSLDERWHIRKNGELFFANGSCRALHDASGRLRGFVKIAKDDTKARRTAEELRDALAHHEILVREVSHRVKNSLALVASVLGLQARSVQHEQARRALLDAQARVGTVAQVHDQLWRSDSLSTVDLADFLRGLCDKLRETAPDLDIAYDAEGPAAISRDRAVPIGLLVNELVTNAMKYAYPGGTGKVVVSLTHAQRDRVRVEVADAGQGLPPGLDLSGTSSGNLGFRLIRGLVRQLGATIEVSSAEPGVRFSIEFDRDA